MHLLVQRDPVYGRFPCLFLKNDNLIIKYDRRILYNVVTLQPNNTIAYT